MAEKIIDQIIKEKNLVLETKTTTDEQTTTVEPIREYDAQGNMIYCKDDNGEWWGEYNEKGSVIRFMKLENNEYFLNGDKLKEKPTEEK